MEGRMSKQLNHYCSRCNCTHTFHRTDRRGKTGAIYAASFCEKEIEVTEVPREEKKEDSK